MSNLVFDEKGNLHPYSIINLDLETFQKVFVTQHEHSVTRKRLFENYQVYTNDLIKIISRPFFQWIDGSFVTKKLNPGDIDVVTFVDYQVFKERRLLFMDRQNLKATQGIDSYFVRLFPVGHPDHFITQFNMIEWQELFGYSRRDENNLIHRKGIIQINF